MADRAGPKGEAAVSDEVRGLQEPARDPVVVASPGRADIVPFSEELFQSLAKGEAVVLDDQHLGCRESLMETGNAVHTHRFYIARGPRPQTWLDLDFDQARESVRELRHGRRDLVRHENGLQRPAVAPGLVERTFSEGEAVRSSFNGAEEIGEDRDAIRTLSRKGFAFPVSGEPSPLPCVEVFDVVFVVCRAQCQGRRESYMGKWPLRGLSGGCAAEVGEGRRLSG